VPNVVDGESGPAPALTIGAHRAEHDDGVVIEVSGEVDLATAPQLQRSFDEALRDEATPVVVDLNGVTFLGSIGLSLLIRAHGQAGPGRLRVVAQTDAARRTIELTALGQVLSMFPTVSAALGAE
jgi:anti-anti-sigma factor